MPPAQRLRVIIFPAMGRTSSSSTISIISMLKLKTATCYSSSIRLLFEKPSVPHQEKQLHILLKDWLLPSWALPWSLSTETRTDVPFLLFSLGWQKRDRIWPSAHKDFSGMGYTYLLDNASWPFYTVWILQWLDMVLCLLLASSLFVLFLFPGPT